MRRDERQAMYTGMLCVIYIFYVFKDKSMCFWTSVIFNCYLNGFFSLLWKSPRNNGSLQAIILIDCT